MKRKLSTTHRAVLGVLALLTIIVAVACGGTTGPGSGTIGAPPTDAIISADRGPYSTTSVTAVGTSGFGGGTIYLPTNPGTYGGMIIAPGFTATKESLAWLGPRLSSFGFVVFLIDTTTVVDQPAQRGDELLAAKRFLTSTNQTQGKLDASRIAVGGHSMGGGGTLEAANKDSSLKAAIPIAPWNLNTNWSGVRVPTMIIGGQADTIAPVATMSVPFYNSIPASTPKAYLELTGQSHFFPQTPNTTMAKAMVAWLKLFVDGDRRYAQFVSPRVNGTDISSYKVSGV